MDLRESQKIEGAAYGLWDGQHGRVDELNSRISSRQFSDQPMQPNFGFRPVQTKYSIFPIIDRRAAVITSIQRAPEYNPASHFSPATSNGPVATYLANVNLESVLQNRHVALQHGAEQGVYVPSSNSDLYGFSAVGRAEPLDDRALLFDRPKEFITKTSEIASLVGKDSFHNNTRTQLRGL